MDRYIHKPFAWMEGILLIATLAQRFCFCLAPSARVEPQPLVTLRPRYGIPMILHQHPEILSLPVVNAFSPTVSPMESV